MICSTMISTFPRFFSSRMMAIPSSSSFGFRPGEILVHQDNLCARTQSPGQLEPSPILKGDGRRGQVLHLPDIEEFHDFISLPLRFPAGQLLAEHEGDEHVLLDGQSEERVHDLGGLGNARRQILCGRRLRMLFPRYKTSPPSGR